MERQPCRDRGTPVNRTPVHRASRWLQQPLAPEGQLATIADDEVVVQHDAERAGGRLHLRRHLDIGAGRGGVAARVVVDQDDGGGAEVEAPLYHFPRVDGGVVHRAARLFLIGDQAVAGVEEQHAELLDRLPRHGGVEVAGQPVPVVEKGLVLHLRTQHVQRGGLGGLDGAGGAGADALDLLQLLGAGGQHIGQAAETLDQRLGDGLGVLARVVGEEQDFQDLVIGQRFRAAREQPLAHPVAMAEMAGPGFLGRGHDEEAGRSLGELGSAAHPACLSGRSECTHCVC